MAEDFAGKIALVTGGGNGIGAATCRAFAAAGAQVAVLDRDAASAERVAAGITGRNSHAAAYALDVADRDAFARLAEGITEAWGGIDILVNGAGTTMRRMIAEMSAEDWDRVIAVNLTGAFNGIRAVLPHMRPSGILRARTALLSSVGIAPPKPVAVGPGQTALTRIPSGASS